MKNLPAAFFVVSYLLVTADAKADPEGFPGPTPPKSVAYDYSSYEQQTIDIVLERFGFQIEPQPEGKTVEWVEIVALEVIEPRDPAPRFFNAFHVTSRQYTILREVLINLGDPYREVLIEESARNLRMRPQLSVVICVPVKTRPGHVGLLVITKDIWSLRLNTDFRYSSGGLEHFVLQPSEINVFGTQHIASIRYELDPASWSMGAQYSIPRMTPFQLRTTAHANIIISRENGEVEGSFGGMSIGRPLLTHRTQWSWLTSTSWVHQMTRRFVNAKLATFDADVTPENDRIPYVYRTSRIIHRTSVTRSWGWAIKNDISVGAEYDARTFKLPESEGVNPAALAEFRDARVPSDSTRLSPFVQYTGYTTDYLRVLDFETLGLQEDFRLGHSLILKLYPASSEFGSSRSFFGVFAGAQYTIPFVDGLVRVAVESATEMESDRLSDASVRGTWRVITPRLGLGRLLVDSLVLHRYRNFLNQMSLLGGDGRLRGFPSNYFVGENVVASNIEYRSRPIEILTLHLGGAAFYDVGTAFDRGDEFEVSQSAGFGIRTLFPQLDRVVLRVDVGFPLVEGELPVGVAPVSFFIAAEQAFPIPNLKPP